MDTVAVARNERGARTLVAAVTLKGTVFVEKAVDVWTVNPGRVRCRYP